MAADSNNGQLYAKLAVSILIAIGAFAVILLDGNPSSDTAAFGLLSVVATGWLHTSRQMTVAPEVHQRPGREEASSDNRP